MAPDTNSTRSRTTVQQYVLIALCIILATLVLWALGGFALYTTHEKVERAWADVERDIANKHEIERQRKLYYASSEAIDEGVRINDREAQQTLGGIHDQIGDQKQLVTANVEAAMQRERYTILAILNLAIPSILGLLFGVATAWRLFAARAGQSDTMQHMMDSIPDGSVLTGPDGLLVSVNAAACEMFGYSKEEIIGRQPSEFLTARSDKIRLERRKNLMDTSRLASKSSETGTPRVALYEIEGIRKDGSRVPIELRQTTSMMDGHQYVASTLRDISDRRALEDELDNQISFHEAVLNTMTDAVMVFNESGEILDCSERVLNVFGYHKSGLIGQNVKILMSKSISEQHGHHFENYLSGQNGALTEGAPRELMGRSKDGDLLDLELLLSETQMLGQRIFVGAVRDISSRKILEAEVQKSQKLKALGGLAAGIAHNFNNILTPVLALSEMALEDESINERTRKRIGVIHEASLRGQDLVSEIMKFGDDDTSEQGILDLWMEVHETIALISHGLPGNIKIETYIDAGPFAVVGEPAAIQSIFLNILGNAVDAIGSDAGDICVSSFTYSASELERKGVFEIEAGEYICIEISDSGPGMDKDVIDRIFEPFFTTKAPGDGTGLGLSTSVSVIEAHGGAIEVISEPGEGTTFTILFPCADTHLMGPAEPKPLEEKAAELEFVKTAFG